VRRLPEPVVDREAYRRVKRFIARDFGLEARLRGLLKAARDRLGGGAR